MRLATYNLENLDIEAGNRHSEHRFALLRRHLVQVSADILCLQEVNAQHPSRPRRGEPRELRALDRLLQGTPYANYHRAATRSPVGGGYADVHNLVVLSRWEIGTERQIHHDIVTAPVYRPAMAAAEPALPIRWDRPILCAEIPHPGGRTLHVLNLHLRAPLAAPVGDAKAGASSWSDSGAWAEGYYLAALKRGGQALEARLYAERLLDSDRDALIAVCGDCNAELSEVPLRILAAAPEDVGTPDLAARRLIAIEERLSDEHRFSLLHDGRKVMFDHILVSEALHAHFLRAEVHNADLSDECRTSTPRSGSYHAPVVAIFDLP